MDVRQAHDSLFRHKENVLVFFGPENKLERESAVFKQGILRNQNLPQNLYNLAGTAILLLTLPKHCVRQSLSFGSPFCECELKSLLPSGSREKNMNAII